MPPKRVVNVFNIDYGACHWINNLLSGNAQMNCKFFVSVVVLLLCQSIANSQGVFSIGNSLTVDALPFSLDGASRLHGSCNRDLQFIFDNPQGHCVGSSTPWPTAFSSFEFDTVVVQPFIGSNLEQDATVISEWMSLEPNANFILNTGWSGHENFAADFLSDNTTNQSISSAAYFADLIKELEARNPGKKITTTRTNEILFSILEDVENGVGPVKKFSDLYRDPIHMELTIGRYIAHNALRQALGQPLINPTGITDLTLTNYFDSKILAVKKVAPVLLGDTNLDKTVNFLDISPFITVMSRNGFMSEADLNQDSAVDFLDIGPFINVLGGQ